MPQYQPPSSDILGLADKIIPFLPAAAAVYLILAGLAGILGFVGSLVSFSLGGMIGSLAALLMAAIGYAGIIMFHRIYQRVMGLG